MHVRRIDAAAAAPMHFVINAATNVDVVFRGERCMRARMRTQIDHIHDFSFRESKVKKNQFIFFGSIAID